MAMKCNVHAVARSRTQVHHMLPHLLQAADFRLNRYYMSVARATVPSFSHQQLSGCERRGFESLPHADRSGLDSSDWKLLHLRRVTARSQRFEATWLHHYQQLARACGVVRLQTTLMLALALAKVADDASRDPYGQSFIELAGFRTRVLDATSAARAWSDAAAANAY